LKVKTTIPPPPSHIHQEQSLGSGVIVSADGYILSNYHVVEGADEVKVGLPDGRGDVMAKVIGTDPATDIAVLKVPVTNLTAVTMTDTDNVQVGDVVLRGQSVRRRADGDKGIVSALDEAVWSGGLRDFIQPTPRLIRHSGGPLIDTEGRLVGINTFI